MIMGIPISRLSPLNLLLFLLILGCSESSSQSISPQSISLSQEEKTSLTQKPWISAPLEIEIKDCSEDLPLIWSGQVDGREDRGYYYPEEEAVYWVAILPRLQGKGERYEIRGQYPEVRFFSLQSYTTTGLSVDAAFDHQIQANQVSIKPFQSPKQKPTDRYTVNLVEGSPPKFELFRPRNTFYAGEDQVSLLIYRTYAPTPLDGDPIPSEFEEDPEQWRKQGQQFLPKIYYIADHRSEPTFQSVDEICDVMITNGAGDGSDLPQLTTQIGDVFIPILSDLDINAGSLASNPPQWFVGSTFVESLIPLFEGFPNLQMQLRQLDETDALTEFFANEANAYLASFINPAYGEIVVTHYRAPTFPNTQDGEPIDPETQNTRFWSVCVNDPFLLYVTGCLSDRDVDINPDGTVTLVFSREKNRPIDPDTGLPVSNWLALPSPVSIVLYRHTLPSRKFFQSHVWYKDLCDRFDFDCLQNYTAISKWMRQYYPVSIYCSRDQFELNQCREP